MKKELLIIGLLIAVVALSGCTSSSSSQRTSPAATEKVYQAGEKFRIGDISYVVNGFVTSSALGSAYSSQTTEGAYYIVEITMENRGNKEKSVIPSNDFVVIANNGNTYKPDLMLLVYAKMTGFNSFSSIEKLQPGIPKTGVLVFEMPKGTTGKIKVDPGWLSGSALVELSSTRPEEYSGKNPKEIALKAEEMANDGFNLNENDIIDEETRYQSLFANAQGVVFSQLISKFRRGEEIDMVELKNMQIADGYREWENFSIGESSFGLKWEVENSYTLYYLFFKKQSYAVMLVLTGQDSENVKAILNKYGKIIEARID